MSNQEQQFYPPGQYPPTPQQSQQYYQVPNNVNDDSGEQQSQEVYGDSEYYTGRSEKLQPRSPRRKSSRRFWFLLIVLLFIGGVSYGVFGSHNQDGRLFGHSLPEQTFNIANPKLVITDTAGTIHIRSDDDSTNAGTVTVRMDKSGGSQSDPTVKFDSTSGTITIVANSQGLGDNNVDIDITTPKTSSVQLTDGNGDIDIQDVTGTINAQTTKGRINADHVSGQVAFSSTDGDVSVDNGSLSGQSSLHSDNGDIHYNGSIDAQGSYSFDTINGSVDVGLPDDTTFQLKAQSNNGHVEDDFENSDASGAGPQVTIISVNGSIQVSKNG